MKDASVANAAYIASGLQFLSPRLRILELHNYENLLLCKEQSHCKLRRKPDFR